MLEVELPDLNLVPVTLDPVPEEALMHEDKQQQQQQQQAPRPLADWLSVGEPVAIPLSPKWAGRDEDLAHFIRAEAATHRYWLVHLACTMNPASGGRIEAANLTCYLGRDDGVTGKLPIAMSMAPSRVRDIQPLKTTRSLKVSADLKVVTPAIEYDWATDRNAAADIVVAFNLQRPEPFWSLTESATLALEGSFRFAVVVRAVRETAATLKVELDGRARQTRFGVFKFRSALPQRLGEPIALP
jgi:hypothetical protein